jgi:hypothetical protein
VATYVGQGSDPFSVSGIGFKPDFIWVKRRNAEEPHILFDSVRGVPNALTTSDSGGTSVEFTNEPIASIDRDGWSYGSGTSAALKNSGGSFVAWTWKAGGNSNTFNIDDVGYASAAAAGLDGGTITPTGASVNTKSGFSIITYTGNETQGDTVAHGLGKNPAFIIIKRRTGGTSSWLVGHQSLATNWGQVLYLNLPDGQFDQTAPFNDTAPTSSVWTMWDSSSNNASGSTYVAYLWADVPGLQKFGSFEGNGSSDGPFVELGFRPAIVLFKNIDTGGTNYDWVLYDSERSQYNPNDKFLCPNLSKIENVRGDGTTDNARYVDFLSNGFKIRNDSSPVNASETIIYAAWAEAPSFNLYGAQSNAR